MGLLKLDKVNQERWLEFKIKIIKNKNNVDWDRIKILDKFRGK